MYLVVRMSDSGPKTVRYPSLEDAKAAVELFKKFGEVARIEDAPAQRTVRKRVSPQRSF